MKVRVDAFADNKKMAQSAQRFSELLGQVADKFGAVLRRRDMLAADAIVHLLSDVCLDDAVLSRQMAKLQLIMGGQISRTAGLGAVGLGYREEERRQHEERAAAWRNLTQPSGPTGPTGPVGPGADPGGHRDLLDQGLDTLIRGLGVPADVYRGGAAAAIRQQEREDAEFINRVSAVMACVDDSVPATITRGSFRQELLRMGPQANRNGDVFDAALLDRLMRTHENPAVVEAAQRLFS